MVQTGQPAMLLYQMFAYIRSNGLCKGAFLFMRDHKILNPKRFRLWDAQREDAAFIGFQLWVLGMSVVAVSSRRA